MSKSHKPLANNLTFQQRIHLHHIALGKCQLQVWCMVVVDPNEERLLPPLAAEHLPM